MADENKDHEIDQFLVDKISKAIDLLSEPKNLVVKPYPFKNEVRSLLSDLQRTRKEGFNTDVWLGVRRGNLYTLNNLVTEWQQLPKIQASLSSKEASDARENIKKSLRKMKKDISAADQESSLRGDRDASVHSVHDQEPDYPTYTRYTTDFNRWSSRHAPRKVHGIEHKVLALVRELAMRNTDAPFKAFGVVGAAGIGKTTLCQSLFDNKFVKEHFSPRIWVCLSKKKGDRIDYNEEIVVRMLNCLGIEDELIDDAANGGLKKLILLLRLQLIGKRYLIVFDDAWNEDKFFFNLAQKDRLDEDWGEELAYGLPKGYGGSVVSTSRSKELLQKMFGEDVSLQYMEPLKHEIIYEIFKDAVIGYDDEEREYYNDLDQIKEELLNRCDGIPMAAKLLAKIAWRDLDIKPKLKSPKPQETPTFRGETSRDIGKAPEGGNEERIGGDRGARVSEIGDDQTA